MNTLDELIGDIANKNGIMLQKDDPICMLYVAFQHLENLAGEEQQKRLQAFVSALEAEQMKWNMESRARAERIVSMGLEKAQKTGQDLVVSNVQDVEEVISLAMAPKIAFLEQQYQKIYYLTIANMFAAAFLAFAALFAFFLP